MPRGIPKNGHKKRILKTHTCSRCSDPILTLNITESALCWNCDRKKIQDNAKTDLVLPAI